MESYQQSRELCPVEDARVAGQKGGKEKKRDDEDKQEPELAGADLPEGVPPAAPDTGRQRSESEAAQAEEDAVRLRLPPRAHFPELAQCGN